MTARRYRITWPDMNDVTAIRYEVERAEPDSPAAAKPAGSGFPHGSTIERIGPEAWLLRMPGPTEEELRHMYTFPSQVLTFAPEVESNG